MLRPAGGLAMVWNRRDESVPWVAEMSTVLGWHEQPYSAYHATDWAAAVTTAGGFTPLAQATVPYAQEMTQDLLAARVRSISYIAALDVAAANNWSTLQSRCGRLRRAVPAAVRLLRPLVPSHLSAMASALLGWFAGRQRDLPWRRTRDPWAILVSELMLQQTQVARVVYRFEAFLTTFPTPTQCAASPVGEVITSWAGLGYNRRAVNLHRTATAVVAEHGGRLPDRLDALVALPGIGPYTACGARFAFEQDVGVLDVNAVRVLSRVTGRSITQQETDALVPHGHSWTWNQAVLDLGATVCRPVPDCAACPLADAHCGWVKAGRRDPDPWVRAETAVALRRLGPARSRSAGRRASLRTGWARRASGRHGLGRRPATCGSRRRHARD